MASKIRQTMLWIVILGACTPIPLDDDDHDGFSLSSDCNDDNAAINPAAEELCTENGEAAADEDCDGNIDEAPTNNATAFYIDLDGDGYGRNDFPPVYACTQPQGYAPIAGDCDDEQKQTNPDSVESCDGEDNNCNSEIDEGLDEDQDGFAPCQGDCKDSDPSIYPGRPEQCDEVDNDCDSLIDESLDEDQDGWSLCAGDCNDQDGSVYPNATEPCNGLDDDCDGRIDEESDRDGDQFTTCGEDIDCADGDRDIHPGAEEVCDGQDQDCDNAADEGFVDEDGDGSSACVDCDDNNVEVSPLSFEVCDGFDNNCNGLIDDNSDCPCEVHTFSGGTYLFCLSTADWHTARQNCQDYGYDLVIPNDAEENNWLNYTANSLLLVDWWIGLTDSMEEGLWLGWDQSEPDYDNWASGEPNNLENEDCAAIYPDGSWNDKQCSTPWYRFICELPEPSDPETPTP